MSGTNPDILEKTFQEVFIHIHRRFLPFGQTKIVGWGGLAALLRPIRGILIQLHGPTPRICSNLGSCIIQLMSVFAEVPFGNKKIYTKNIPTKQGQNLAQPFLKPAESGLRFLVSGCVRFDIQDRCSFDHIHPLDMQNIFIPFDEPENRKTYGIGPIRASGGKNASLLAIVRRMGVEFSLSGFVESEDKDDMGESVEILQAFGIFFENLQFSPDGVESFGIRIPEFFDVFFFLERRMDRSDWFKSYFHRSPP